jgi:hypothetical protein
MVARRDSLDRTLIDDIRKSIEMTPNAFPANTVRSIGDPMVSNAKIISCNTSGIIITLAKTTPCLTFLGSAVGAQR